MSSVEEQREQITNRLGEPDRLRFPSGWTLSSSWHRAQAAPSAVGPVNRAESDDNGQYWIPGNNFDDVLDVFRNHTSVLRREFYRRLRRR